MTPDRWPQVKGILQAALELDGEERAAYLDAACGANAKLRDQVEELLAADQHMGEFLASPLAGLSIASEPAGSDESVSGRIAGPYRILREIGRGGMGTVYLAERADGHYRKHVAIKLINADLGGASVLRRFRNERQILATLEHPNIARLIDGGVTGDGCLYMVMEYVEGARIDRWCDGRNLPVPDRIRLFRQVCDAVQSAHDKLVIHRDIKPANIVVTQEGTPKLLDFGIAKVLNDEWSGELSETTVGPGPMTPAYASPEQARGERTGAASDIYALGVVLHQLLTGRLPALSPSAEMEVSAMSGESPAAQPRRMRGDLDHVLVKALSRDPKTRYASVAKFSEDLDRVLSDQPVRAHKDTVLYRGGKFLKRNRAQVAAGVVGAILVLALVAGVNRFTGTSDAVRAIAVLPLENLSGDREQEYFTDGMTDALINELARIRGLRVISRTSVMSYKGVRRRLPEIGRSLGVRTIAEGSVVRSGTRVRIALRLVDATNEKSIWSGSYEGELQNVLALQSQVAGAIAGEIDATLNAPDQARISRARRVDLGAYDAYLKGRNQFLSEFSEESLKKAVAWFEKALALDPGYASAYAGLADCYYMVSNMYYPPREMMPKARRAALKALELDDTLGEAHAILGLVRTIYEFNRAEAEKAFQRALDLKPGDSQAHLWYSIHLSGMGRFDEALAEVEQARRLDPNSPAINAYTLNPLLWSRRPEEVIQRMTPLAEMYPDYNQPHYGLAMAYEQKREWVKAIREMERANALEMTQDGLAQLGHMYAVSGRTADARRVLRQLTEMSRTRYVSAYNIGVLHTGLGEIDEAFRWLQQVEEDRSDWFASINVDPRLDVLHHDPRWAGILRSVGLAR